MVQAIPTAAQQVSNALVPAASTASGSVLAQPRFFFGVKGDVKNNVLFLDDNIVAYPCGHNVVVYYMQEKMQRFIPGIEGSQGITALALSPSRKFLAVCEKGNNAICTVYNIGKFLEQSVEKRSTSIFDVPVKKRKILCSAEDPAREFVSVDFCAKNEKLLVTTSAGPEARAIIWNWDKQRCVAFCEFAPRGKSVVNQISFSPVDPSIVVITGNDLYRYCKLDGPTFKVIINQINRRDTDGYVSNNYTCHAWLNDGRFVVCNDHGEIMLIDSSGEYKGVTISDPRKESFPIWAITTFSGVSTDGAGAAAAQGKAAGSNKSGFIVAGISGRIRVFIKSDVDPKKPYVRAEGEDLQPDPSSYMKDSTPMQQMVYKDIDVHKIRSIVLSPMEDNIVFTTSSDQVIKVPQFNVERPADDQKYEHLISSFHSKPIFGLDVCIKKELVATCSSDRTVRLWSYTAANMFQSELCFLSDTEAHAIAFHPSGLHLVVGFSDNVRLMNILDKQLVMYKQLPIKECREIVFSNGGHLFACQNDKEIWVYKFYTAQLPQIFKFVAHQQPVKRIAWLDDDTGFVSCGQDAMIYVWKLYPFKGDAQNPPEQNPISNFKLLQKISFSSVACYKPEGSLEPLVYATGSDRSIREIAKDKELLRYEENLTYSQILVGYGRNLLYTGLCEPNRPGSIQIFRYANDSIEKAAEVQAHAQQIERMRLNYDNSKLFSVGIDGTLCCFSIKDLDSASKAKAPHAITHSEEILIEKESLDQINMRIKTLKADIELQEKTRDMQLKQTMAKNDEEIKQLEEEIEDQNAQYENITRQLTMQKEKVDQEALEQQSYLIHLHEQELKVKKEEYQNKTIADAKRREDLEKAKEEQKLDFTKNIQELFLQQDKAKAEMQQEHALQKKQKEDEYRTKQKKIEELEQMNIDQRRKIEEEAWIKIDDLKDSNKAQLSEIIEQGMKSKADLQKETGKYRSADIERQTLTKEIKEKASMSRTLDQSIIELKNQIEAQKNELESRRATIEDKDARIIELKKKTQELEKFKFVLDYKIKELKRDILPRENNITSLHEQVTKMQIEVKHFHTISANLDLIVNDLKMRHKGLEDENLNAGHKLDMQEIQKKRFKDDVFEVVQHITDYKKLKRGVIRLYKTWVKEETNRKKAADQNTEHTDDRKVNETQIIYYRNQLTRNLQQHRENNSRLMKDNVYLIRSINAMRHEQHDLEKQIKILGKGVPGNAGDQSYQNDARKDLEMMDLTIQKYQTDLQAESEINQQLHMRRPPQRLPPLQQNQDGQQQMMEMDENQGIYQEQIQQHHEEESYQQVSQTMQMSGNENLAQPGQMEEQEGQPVDQQMDGDAQDTSDPVQSTEPPAQQTSQQTALEQPDQSQDNTMAEAPAQEAQPVEAQAVEVQNPPADGGADGNDAVDQQQ